MNCKDVLNVLDDDEMTLTRRLRVAIHLAFCRSCAAEKRRLNAAYRMMNEDFMPLVSSGFSNAVMRLLGLDESLQTQESFSLRGWTAVGVFILLSLASSYLGVDFRSISESNGSSFVLPVGITVGCVITVYGALFIGSHMEDLREKFVH